MCITLYMNTPFHSTPERGWGLIFKQKTMFDAIHEHSLLLQFAILTDILRVSGGQNREFVVITYLLQQPMTNSRHYWSERGACIAVRQTKYSLLMESIYY